MKGKFYAVGVGPGDPELLTLKSIRVMKNVAVIAVPKSGSGDNMALAIAREYVEGKPVLTCEMPMTKDPAVLAAYHEKSAHAIAAYLNEGKDVAFLTIGDPAIYSTVMYVHRILSAQGYETAMVPGIPSFCAAAAALNTSLCERDELLHIVPATYTDYRRENLPGNKILMKSGKSIQKMREKLIEDHAQLVEKAGLPEERVYKDMRDLPDDLGYFTLVVIKQNRN